FKLKALFETSPKEEAYDIAFRIGTLLHEGAVTLGYKSYATWDKNRHHELGVDRHPWGYSASSGNDGATVHRANAVFIADNKRAQPVTATAVRAMQAKLAPLADPDTLRVLFELYELTFRDFDRFVTPDELTAKCR